MLPDFSLILNKARGFPNQIADNENLVDFPVVKPFLIEQHKVQVPVPASKNLVDFPVVKPFLVELEEPNEVIADALYMVNVSIILPCLNEAKTLPDCILNAIEALRVLRQRCGYIGEVIVADNGSTDGSIDLAWEHGARVIHVEQRGYGNAVRGGVDAARGRFIVMADSDGSYDLRESVPMIMRLSEGYELCNGSRFKGRIMPHAMPWKNRLIGNPLLSGILNLLFHSGLSDAHCGLRAFTKKSFERMHLTATGMEFASEMIIKATLLDLKRTETPITLHPDGRGRPPHLRPWRDGWRHLRHILMLSPTWLFLIPSAFMFLLGLFISIPIVFNHEPEIIASSSVHVRDHWMLASAALIAIAHQAAVLGVATILYGVRAGYRQMSPLVKSVCKISRVEPMLIIGISGVILGGVILAQVYGYWANSRYELFCEVRGLVLSITIILLGLQNIFGGFFIAIVTENTYE